jgi:four helix bundle protein
MKNFKELKIWQKGIAIAAQSFQLVQAFPKEERFGLSLQITRAAVSIPSNIAEGSSRSSEKDYNRYLEIALGSGFELETQILIAQSANFGNKALRDSILKELNEVQKMLASFMRQLQK